MKNITNEQMEKFRQIANDTANCCKDSADVKDIMTRYYLDHVPSAEKSEAESAACRITDKIAEFDNTFSDAVSQKLESVIDKYQNLADDGRNSLERCKYWESVAAALQNREAADFTEEEVDEGLASKLRNNAKKALMELDVSASSLNEKADYLAGFSNGEAVGNYIINLENEKKSTRALTAMVAYVAFKNGDVENPDIEANPEVIAVAVCSATEEVIIMEEVEKGNLPLKVATRILQVLLIVSVTMFLVILFKAGLIAVSALSISAFLALMIKILMIILFVYMVLSGIEFSVEFGKMLAEGAFNIFGKIASGFRKLAKEKKASEKSGNENTDTQAAYTETVNTEAEVIDNSGVVTVG